jgi:hypothetical protein
LNRKLKEEATPKKDLVEDLDKKDLYPKQAGKS